MLNIVQQQTFLLNKVFKKNYQLLKRVKSPEGLRIKYLINIAFRNIYNYLHL